jgi:hypothetical protein
MLQKIAKMLHKFCRYQPVRAEEPFPYTGNERPCLEYQGYVGMNLDSSH